MARHIFLTGDIQVGKSTLIHRVLALHPGLRLGGFYTLSAYPGADPSLRHVYMVPAAQPDTPCDTGNTVALCHPGRPLRRFADVFDRLGPVYLAQPDSPDLVLMDELGTLEGEALRFQAAVLARLNGPIPVLGVIKPKGHPFLQAIRRRGDVQVIEVSARNREELAEPLDRLICIAMQKAVDETRGV